MAGFFFILKSPFPSPQAIHRPLFDKFNLTFIYLTDKFNSINSEQAGRPRSSRPGQMKTGMIRSIMLEDGDVMEFKELPTGVQKAAAHTLHSVLLDMGTDIESEPAKKLARIIGDAFVSMYADRKQDTKVFHGAVNFNSSCPESCQLSQPAELIAQYLYRAMKLQYHEPQKSEAL